MRVFLFLCFLLSDYHAIAQYLDTLVTVDNHQLHFSLIPGQGVPILFESGNGDDSSVWEPLLAQIHTETGATLLTYDRAGLGKSGIDPRKISFKREAKNLKKALKKLGYKNDFFLVAHSFGSFYAAEFSQRHKGKIRGAVLIDVSTPCSLTVEYATRVKNSISEEIWALIKTHKLGLYHVLRNFPELAAYISNRFLSDSIPLTILAAEIREANPEIGETEQDLTRVDECLKALGSLPNNKYVLAKSTGHKVWKDDPQIVIDNIVEWYKK
ncbi:MAG: alpha/beta hydrolase, partial [Bacteroidota bacterium]